MTDLTFLQRHVTGELKIQQQQPPPNKTFPFLLMAFVFAHVTHLGPAAMSQTSGNRIRQTGVCPPKKGE